MLFDRGLHAPEQRSRQHAQGDGHHHQRDEGAQLTAGDVLERQVYLVLDGAEEDLLEHHQQVNSREDDAQGRRGGHELRVGQGHGCSLQGRHGVVVIGAHQDQELTHEAAETGQSHRAEHDDHVQGGELGNYLPDAAVLGHEPGVASLVEHTEPEEQSARGDAVGDHHEDGPLDPLDGQGHQAQNHEAQVADGGVGDELLGVLLGVGQ